MKKIIVLPIVILLFSSAYAQSLKLPALQDPFKASQAYKTAGSSSGTFSNIQYFPRLRFYGWSRDSKIAYSLEKEEPGIGGFKIHYIIQDLKSNRIVWQLQDDTNNWNDTAFKKSKNSTGEYSLKLQKAKLETALKSHKIVTGNYQLKSLPIQYIITETYRYEVEIEEEVVDTGRMKYERFKLINYKIFAHKSDNTSKQLLEKKNIMADNIYPCGYYLSPYEQLAVVIIAEEKYVFEGNGLDYVILGCSLTKGFK